jgi:hypothetical protein
MIKSFRGLIADGGQQRINLHTNDGKTGYRIVKFQIFANRPGESGADAEHSVQIWTVKQTSITNVVDFSNQVLLGAASMGNSQSAYVYGSTPVIIFDREIFNQDIHITHVDTNGSESVNYYIELEQINLDLDESTVATLQSIRSK